MKPHGTGKKEKHGTTMDADWRRRLDAHADAVFCGDPGNECALDCGYHCTRLRSWGLVARATFSILLTLLVVAWFLYVFYSASVEQHGSRPSW